MSKQTKITKAARGRDCQVRLPGCPNDTDTTVLAHYRLAGTCGMGIKPNNLQGAWACDFCHSCIDGRIKHPLGMGRDEMRIYHAEGVMRTIDVLVSEGVVAA
ncbi:hypothetical protein BFW91_01145 [Pseudomonas fluorescens]|uniref:DUF1364 domain-containing protein n=1 Tax=Pseudomonas fluorescens TaxID=294 RepID=UPI00099CF022|nr:DUF1364 domain-containing protein [Pseudomonas fluorescens]OPB16720.1 hypothetical protein BFW91_01145 [Pseudomonas fluorescens]